MFNFLDRLSKNTHVSNFMKFRSVGDKFFHVNGQKTDITKLKAAFAISRNFLRKHISLKPKYFF